MLFLLSNALRLWLIKCNRGWWKLITMCGIYIALGNNRPMKIIFLKFVWNWHFACLIWRETHWSCHISGLPYSGQMEISSFWSMSIWTSLPLNLYILHFQQNVNINSRIIVQNFKQIRHLFNKPCNAEQNYIVSALTEVCYIYWT